MPERKKPTPRVTVLNAPPPYDEPEDYVYFVDGDDLVTAVPLKSFPPRPVDFKHAGTLQHIDRGGHITTDPTRFRELATLVRDRPPFDAEGRLDQLVFNHIPNGVEDHVPTLYATHIWNAYAGGQNGRG